jgi:hypothetical protein
MANSFCVMFQRNEIPDALPENKSQAMPAHRPNAAWFMPGDPTPKPARGQMKNLPWRSWLGPKRPHSKRAKRKSSLGTLMGR